LRTLAFRTSLCSSQSVLRTMCIVKNSFYLNSLIIGRVTHPLTPLSLHLK
jgi:hypothetical protein